MAGRPGIRADVSIPKRVHSLRITARVFVKFVMGKVVKAYHCWVVGFEPTTQKPMFGTTPFIEDLEGISPFDHLRQVNLQPTQSKLYENNE